MILYNPRTMASSHLFTTSTKMFCFYLYIFSSILTYICKKVKALIRLFRYAHLSLSCSHILQRFVFTLKLYIFFSYSYNQCNCIRSESPGRVAQSVGHLTRKSGVLGSIPGLATYFRFSLRFFKKGSCQLLAKVCARSTG